MLFHAYFEDCEPLWLSYYCLFSIWLQRVWSLFFLVIVKDGYNLLHCYRENVRDEIVMLLMCVRWTYLCHMNKTTRGNEDYQKWFPWLTFCPHQCDLWGKLVLLFRFVMIYNSSTSFRASSGFVTAKFAVHVWL